MPTVKMLRKFRAYFTANFHSQDFSYVLYPFARILKIFSFVPVKLKHGEVLCQKVDKLEWDALAWIWNLINFIIYIVGFGFGVYNLHLMQHMTRGEDNSTVITLFTSWMQIVALFILGAAALITSWLHMDDLRRLCVLIYKIDRQLRLLSDIQFDYKRLRKRLFIELCIEFLVAFPLSMVNCIIIQPTLETATLISTCFWFICFIPIMLIIFKEFVFYNLMFILKSKLELINGKLATFTYGASARKRIVLVCKMQSVSEMPLTAVPSNASSSETVEKPCVETLQKLLEIYSNVADGIELVLRIFSSHLLFLTAVSFGVITIQSYNLFAIIMHSLEMQTHQVMFIVTWILVQIAAIGINVSVCSMTAKTMSTTVSLLHKMKAQCNSDASACMFYQILQIFSLEILQRKHNFTAGGFFDMNYKLITSIVGAATTYLVIIIQFHLTNIPDCHFAQH